MNGIQLTFELALRSDYHVGSGHGLGLGVDSALLRDADGKPVLRGTTLAALMREGLRQLLNTPTFAPHHPHTHANGDYGGQCEGARTASLCWECRIFGAPRLPKRWIFSSARPSGYQAVAPTASNHELTWGGQPATRVRVNPRTRRAEKRKLFTIEEGDCRLTFRFTVTCCADDANSLPEALLLVAAARMVRRLGAHRTRGRGECLIKLVEAQGADGRPVFDEEGGILDVWLRHFEAEWLRHPDRQPADVGRPSMSNLPALQPRLKDARPYCVRVIARADEPVLIARRAEAGNEFESLDYIPGGALLGALASRADARLDLNTSAASAIFSELFVNGRIRFGNLHPAKYEDPLLYPSCIPPLNLLTCKLFPGYKHDAQDQRHHGVWDMRVLLKGDSKCPECDADLERLEQPIVLRSIPERLNLHKREELHQRINPMSGRVAQGNLFGYVALGAGQYFIGDIICEDEADWQALCQLTGIETDKVIHLRVGKAARRGYGLLSLVLQPCDTADSQVRAPFDQRVTRLDQPIFLTLLSDAIVTDTWGRFITTFSEDWLAEALSLPAGSTQIVEGTLAVGVRLVDGFNTQHGLPRWRDIALVAGSSVAIHLSGVTLDQLRIAEQRGIGLRRSEGFGRIAFNHPLYPPVRLLDSAGISLPDELKSATNDEASAIAIERKFRGELNATFDAQKNWSLFRYAQCGSVVRLLLAARNSTLQALREQLERLQQPDHVLQAIGVEKREKEVWFSRGEGKQALLKLLDDRGGLLLELERTIAEQPEMARARCYAIGVEMLAERIAAQVRRARQK